MKQDPNITLAQLVEDGGPADTLETMYSVVVGNGAAVVPISGGHSNGTLLTPGVGSALQAAIRFTGGTPVGDIANTAKFTADGHFDPGVNIGTDHVLVVWLHYPGDGDAANSWN